jgi:hypothetical protein
MYFSQGLTSVARKTIYMPLSWFENNLRAERATLVECQRRAARLYAQMEQYRKGIAQTEAIVAKARAKGLKEAPIPRD